jgi:hypothetical protein
MKTLTNLFVFAATAGLLGTNALADDPALRSQIAIQRAQMEREQRAVTVALYARERGVSERVTTERYRGLEERPVMIPKARGETQYIERSRR